MTRDEMIAALVGVAATPAALVRAAQATWPNITGTINSVITELRAGGPDGMATRVTDPALSSLASDILANDYKPTRDEVKSMAGSLLSQSQPEQETTP